MIEQQNGTPNALQETERATKATHEDQHIRPEDVQISDSISYLANICLLEAHICLLDRATFEF